MLMARSSSPELLENEFKDCSLDELTSKELQLALKLKKEFCVEFQPKKWKETEPKKSAPLFYQLGKLYQAKAEIQSQSKKLSLIKSAALFNAAIVRLESAPEKAQNVKMNLQQLCTEVLLIAGAKNKNANLIGKARSVKENIASMRNYVENELKHVPQISENIFDKQPKEQQKAEKIQVIQAQIAEKYTEIMVEIACFCEEVMGEPPCKYAIVGMGSLARKEITPYSDFEHVIVLENITDYEPKLRYFKWLSVIFHVIIINIQETILPSVMIESLNNHPEFEDWFFDDVTLSGISFDGMMPHACKFPLGRQTPTKAKPWKTELIKPVDGLLQYLQSGENLKNGYHLGDILTKVCFVHGDSSMFTEFENGVKSLVEDQIEDNVQQLRRQVAEDLQNFATSLHVKKKPHDKINVKKEVYRSTTLFISALGRHHKICDSSCFGILHRLQQNRQIDGFTKQKLEYAVAVACEIRLRWYMKQKRQCDTIENESNNIETLTRIVDMPSTISYFQISYALQNEIAIQFKLSSTRQVFYLHPEMLNFDLLQMFGNTQQLLPVLQNCNSMLEKEGFYPYPNNKQPLPFHYCMDLLEKNNWTLFFNTKKTEISVDISRKKEIAEQFRKLAWTLLMHKSFNEALNNFKKSNDKWNGIEKEILEKEFDNTDPILAVSVGYSISKNDCLVISLDESANNPKEAITKRFFDEVVLTKNHDINYRKFELLSDMGNCLLQFNKPHQALEYNEKALLMHLSMRKYYEKESMNLVLMDHTTVRLLHNISRCFQRMEKFDDACKYLQCALSMLERLPPPFESEYIPKEDNFVNVWVTFGCCLIGKGDYANGRSYLEKALKFFESYPRISHSAEKRIERKEIAKSFLKENNTDYLLQNHEEILQSINHSFNMNLNYSHKSFALDIHELGLCLFNKLMYKNANKYFEVALDLLLKLSDDVETDIDIAEIHQHIGDSLHALKEYKKAYNHFHDCVRIRKQATQDDVYEKAIDNPLRSMADEQKVVAYQRKSNPDFIAHIWLKMFKCHVHVDEVDNAVLCFENFCLEMNKLSIDISQSLVDVYEMLSNQSLKMQRYDKAKTYLNHLLESKQNVSESNVSSFDGVAIYGYIGLCCIKLNNFVDAKHWLSKTLDRISKTRSNSHELDNQRVPKRFFSSLHDSRQSTFLSVAIIFAVIGFIVCKNKHLFMSA